VDFIERFLGLSPDNGDSSFERALFVMLSILIMLAAMFILHRHPVK